MLTFRGKVFDDAVTGLTPVYTGPELYGPLATMEKAFVSVIARQNSGTAPKLTMDLQRSNDGVNWETQASLFSGQNLTVGDTDLLYAEDTGSVVVGCYCRLHVVLDGTNPTSHLEVYVTGRARCACTVNCSCASREYGGFDAGGLPRSKVRTPMAPSQRQPTALIGPGPRDEPRAWFDRFPRPLPRVPRIVSDGGPPVAMTPPEGEPVPGAGYGLGGAGDGWRCEELYPNRSPSAIRASCEDCDASGGTCYVALLGSDSSGREILNPFCVLPGATDEHVSGLFRGACSSAPSGFLASRCEHLGPRAARRVRVCAPFPRRVRFSYGPDEFAE